MWVMEFSVVAAWIWIGAVKYFSRLMCLETLGKCVFQHTLLQAA